MTQKEREKEKEKEEEEKDCRRSAPSLPVERERRRWKPLLLVACCNSFFLCSDE
jgi:hypothetical protein